MVSDKKGKERPKGSLKSSDKSSERMSCGLVRALNRWESSTRASSSWVSSKSTSGGGIRLARDPRKPSKSQIKLMKSVTMVIAHRKTKKMQRWLYPSRTSSVATVVDSVLTLRKSAPLATRPNKMFRCKKMTVVITSMSICANCWTLMLIKLLWKSRWVKIHGPKMMRNTKKQMLNK